MSLEAKVNSHRALGIVAVLALLAPQNSSAMTLTLFLRKADALEARGALALVSKDFGLLKSEIQGAAAALKAENAASLKAGRPPAFCAPEKTKVSSSELLRSFRDVSAEDRPRTSVKDALRSYMASRYPCRQSA